MIIKKSSLMIFFKNKVHWQQQKRKIFALVIVKTILFETLTNVSSWGTDWHYGNAYSLKVAFNINKVA